MTEETFRLETAPGVTLVIDLLGPPTDPLLVLVPGFWRSRSSPRIRAIARRLAEHSRVAVVDVRGHGEAGGTYTFGALEPADLRIVLTELARRGHARIGVLGFSLGGPIAMQAARELPAGVSVIAAALVSSPTCVTRARPMFWFPDVWRQLQPSEVTRPPRFSLASLAWRRTDAAFARPAGEDFPVRVFHAAGDWLIPHSESGRWAAALGVRARVKVFDLPGRLHADALLQDHLPLSAEILEWWRASSSGGRSPWQ